MTLRWQERKLDDDLLKRELLLRLRAERSAAPGRSRPATEYFDHRVRGLMLRHPLFAFEYYLLKKRPGAPPSPRRRPHVRVGVVAGIVLAAGAGAAILATQELGPSGRPDASAARPQSPLLISGNWWYPPRTVSAQASAKPRPATAQPQHRTQPRRTRRTILVS